MVLETLNSILFAIAVSAMLLLVIRALPAKAKQPNLKVGEYKLPIRLWYIVIPAFIVIALGDRPVLDWATRRWNEAWIEKTDPNRISVIVPDFDGEGGAGAADTFQTMLQSQLGSGVQVIRVPGLPAPPRYGDASKAVENTSIASMSCTARYQGDIVVFGKNFPSAGQASVNFTIKEPDCFPAIAASSCRRFRNCIL